MPHIKSYAQEHLNSWNKKLAYYRQLGVSQFICYIKGHSLLFNCCFVKAKIEVVDEGEKECKSELYIEPLDWFKDRLDDLNGKVN